MSDGFADLLKLAADLTQAPVEARPLVRKALQVTAQNIKTEWREGADKTGLADYARDVTYETKELSSEIKAEIGPTVGDAGSFGFVEDAGGNVKSAPQHAARTAVRNNEEDFVQGLEIALFDATRRAVDG